MKITQLKMKITQLTPQIAAMYLGQECDFVWLTGSQEGVSGHCSITSTCIGLMEPDSLRHKISIKPYLRPLSSMTEAEARELYALAEMLSPWQNNWGSCYDEWWANENGSHYLSIEDIACKYSAVWIKLLEWGFDLFGLIESGLAVDKTTLKSA